MKARFKINTLGLQGLELCKEYPNCKCNGHYVYEKNEKRGETKNDRKK